MKKIQRRRVTLLEVLIALSFTVVVLMILVYFYQQISLVDLELEKSQKQNFQMRYVENRLMKILTKAQKSKKDFFFYTSPDLSLLFKDRNVSLVFTFDNGVVVDKQFSNLNLGRLYLDKNGKLMLASWPAPSRWPSHGNPPLHKEILMDNVESMSFEFFIPPEREEKNPQLVEKQQPKPLPKKEENKSKEEPSQPGKPVKDESGYMEPEPKGTWVKEWKQEYKQLPAMIKIHLKRKIDKKEVEMTFAYPFPKSEKTIFYNK